MRLAPRAQTILGLAVAAALAAAAFSVRARNAAPVGSPDIGPGGAAGALVDISHADAALDLGDARVLVSAGPRPLAAFARNRFRVRVERNGAPLPLQDAVVSFTMTMPMGDHRHPLVAAAGGWHEAEAVLPSCPSGNRRWFGTLEFTLAETRRSARFAFDLQPTAAPGAAQAPRP